MGGSQALGAPAALLVGPALCSSGPLAQLPVGPEPMCSTQAGPQGQAESPPEGQRGAIQGHTVQGPVGTAPSLPVLPLRPVQAD